MTDEKMMELISVVSRRWDIISVFHERGEMRVMDLVDILGKSKVLISSHLVQLRKMGIIYFDRFDLDDFRCKYFKLTPKGKKLYFEMRNLLSSFLRES